MEKLKSGRSGLLLLVMRLVLAHGFFVAALAKLQDVSANAEWFKSIGIPFPILNTWLSGGIEAIGALFLTLGLYTKLTPWLLIFLMIVAIFTVHIGNGFSAANDGFEINVYYIIMLLALLLYGPGKYSLDTLILNNKKMK